MLNPHEYIHQNTLHVVYNFVCEHSHQKNIETLYSTFRKLALFSCHFFIHISRYISEKQGKKKFRWRFLHLNRWQGAILSELDLYLTFFSFGLAVLHFQEESYSLPLVKAKARRIRNLELLYRIIRSSESTPRRYTDEGYRKV